VAATVRSLNHVHALAEKTPDGKIESVHETRLTHLGIHLLCFISIFALNALKVIPMPVLYVSLLTHRDASCGPPAPSAHKPVSFR